MYINCRTWIAGCFVSESQKHSGAIGAPQLFPVLVGWQRAVRDARGWELKAWCHLGDLSAHWGGERTGNLSRWTANQFHLQDGLPVFIKMLVSADWSLASVWDSCLYSSNWAHYLAFLPLALFHRQLWFPALLRAAERSVTALSALQERWDVHR